MNKIIKLFKEIESKHDTLNPVYWELKYAYEDCAINNLNDIKYYLDNYISEEDKIMLAPNELCKTIEYVDFIRSLFNV